MSLIEIENKIKEKALLTQEEIEYFLTCICQIATNIVNHPTYENTCDTLQGLIGKYLFNLGVKIYPCITNKCVTPNCNGHSFIVATFNETDNYLIDPSFIQYLVLDDNYKDMFINHLKITSRSPFYYAKNINEQLLLEFLKKGFYKLTIDFAYMYGNAFYQSSVNILDTTVLNNLPGEYFITQFLQGNEILRDYGYPSISSKI